MFKFDIRADFSKQIKQLEDLKKNLAPQAIVPAMNEVMRDTKVVMVRRIAEQYNVKQSDVRDKIPDPTKASARLGKFEATLYANPYGKSRRALNLVHFIIKTGQKSRANKAKRLAKAFGGRASYDLQFRVRRGGSPFSIPHAFQLNVPGQPVMIRKGPGRDNYERGYVIGIPQMFMAHSVQDVVQVSLPGRFADAFERRMRYVIGRMG